MQNNKSRKIKKIHLRQNLGIFLNRGRIFVFFEGGFKMILFLIRIFAFVRIIEMKRKLKKKDVLE
jgi:hypothetical protein